MHFGLEYGLFLAKALTAVISLLLLIAGIMALTQKTKEKNKLNVQRLNHGYDEMRSTLQQTILSKQQAKQAAKQAKQLARQNKTTEAKPRIFVLDFDGDVRASAVSGLRHAITALLTVLKAGDEVVVCIESGGGMVHAYGLAASQLQRIKQRGIALTVIIDKVAASGGYLMASVADRILAAPFAIIGSIGVVAQLPNFHRLLKKHHVDFEQITAGEFKRTLTMFGENTEKAKQKFQQELDDIHLIFKQFVKSNRPILDIDQVATGEHWLASQALELKLIDDLITSDDYLLQASEQHEVYKLTYKEKRSLKQRLMVSLNSLFSYWR
jgi:serine protease SohB